MDTTQLLYLLGAFLLGFIIAWFAGRGGPKRALEECEANAHALQRSLDDRSRQITKLEAQVKDQMALVDKATSERSTVVTQLTSATQGADEANLALEQLRLELSQAQSDKLSLEAELAHTRDAYAGTRSRVAELTAQLASTEEAAAEAEAENELEETALAVAVVDRSLEVAELSDQVQKLQGELDLARAAAARLSVVAALRPQLTEEKRTEYINLAGKPDQVVAALHARDMAVADARNETDYLRRSLGMLTAAGAELAMELDRRSREQQYLVAQIAAGSAAAAALPAASSASRSATTQIATTPAGTIEPETHAAPVQSTEASADAAAQQQPAAQPATPAGTIEPEGHAAPVASTEASADAAADQADGEDPVAAATAVANDLRDQLDARAAEVTDLQAQLDQAKVDNEALAAKVAAYMAMVGKVVERVQALRGDLDAVTPVAEEPAAAPAAETAPETAPGDDAAAMAAAAAAATPAEGVVPQAARAADAVIPTQPDAEGEAAADGSEASEDEAPVEQNLDKLGASVAAVLALLKRTSGQNADLGQQLGLLLTDKGTLETQVNDLQAAIQERSTRFDALSMHASSLEANAEINAIEMAKLKEQFDALTAEKAALGEELDTKSVGLTEFESRLQSTQVDLEGATTARSELEAALQKLSADLDSYLAQYGEGESAAAAAAPAAEATAAAGETVADAAAATRAATVEVAVPGDAAPQAPAADAPLVEPAGGEAPAASAPANGVPANGVPAAPPAVVPARLFASAAAVGELLRRSKDGLDSANARIGELEDEISALTSEKTDLEALIEQREADIAEGKAQLETAQADLATSTAEIERLNAQLADVQTALSAAEAQRQDLESQLAKINQDLADLGAAFEAGDADALGAVAQRFGTLDLTPAEEAAPAEGAAPDESGEDAATRAAGAPVVKTAGALAVVAAIQKKQADLADVNTQLATLQQEYDTLTAAKADLEAQLTAQNAAVEEARNEVSSLQEQLDSAAAAREEEIQALDQKAAELQAQLDATESARLQLQASLDGLNQDLTNLGAAVDAGDEESLQQFALKLAPPLALTAAAPEGAAEGAAEVTGVAEGEAAVEGAPAADASAAGTDESRAVSAAPVVGVAAVLAAIQRKQAALKEAEAQQATLQTEVDTLAYQKSVVETELAQRTAAVELTPAETVEPVATAETVETAETGETAETVETGETAETAEVTAAAAPTEEMQAQMAALQEQLAAAQSQLEAREVALADLQTRLSAVPAAPAPKTLSDFKSTAWAAADALGKEVQTTETLQDLAEVKHIGVTFEQRLYRARVGTFWEVAHLTDDDLQLVLRLTDMQKLAMSFDEVRADATRLAEETNTVGLLWEGDPPDDFEPIQGIGKVFEQRLYSAGIRTYKQLAATSEERLAEICQARKPLVPDYASWIRQAKMFLEIRNG